MSDWADQKAIEFASESAKQFMALAAAILALASASKIVSDPRKWLRTCVAVSAVGYCVAFGSGALFLLGLTAIMDPEVDETLQVGTVRYEPRQMLTPAGNVVFQRAATPATAKVVQSLPANALVVRLRPIPEPSIWTPFLAATMLIEIGAFSLSTFTFAFAFVWSLLRSENSADTSPLQAVSSSQVKSVSSKKRKKRGTG